MSDLIRQIAELTARPDGVARGLLDALPVAMVVVSAERRFLFANKQAERLFQSSPALQDRETPPTVSRLGEIFEILDPATGRPLPAEDRPITRALAGESVEPREYLVRRAGVPGKHWLEIGAQPVPDVDGTIVAALFTFRRIGDKKKRELALESANRLNSIIYKENLAGIIRSTVDGRILDCNEALVLMLGYSSRKELLSLRVPRLYYLPSERDRILRHLSSAKRLSRMEVCFRRADGSRCWGLLNARLIDPPPGEVGGTIVSSVVDITERKHQEETLRQSEQRFTSFMDHLPGFAFIKDLEGRYLYCNQAVKTLFDIRPEDMVGKTADDIWPADFAALYRENDNLILQTGRPSEYLAPFAHRDGTHSWLFYKFPIIQDGKVAMIGGVGVDVTERRILEEQLAQARKMEALGRLAGGIAHDFNNLLTVIAGYSQLAIETIETVPASRVVAYLEEILTSSRRATDLTGQLLAFSRRQSIQPRVLDLRELVAGMDRLLQRVLGEHIQLSVKSVGETCLIHADQHQMEQAIMNLAANARDAMPLGGQLELRCEHLGRPVTQEGGPPLSVVLEVRDNGIGMDEAVRSRIFDPFFTSKEEGKGTGLGLSTVYGVVSQARGRIDVESSPGEGTVFRLLFPAAEPAPVESPALSRAAGPARGAETILMAEDDPAVRLLTQTILQRLGYKVLVADCGPAALRIWRETATPIDLLLTDVIMPRMSGGELAHQLRELDPHLRVLFMSGYTDDMIASHGVLAGETQLIQKPFNAESLGRKLRAVLDA